MLILTPPSAHAALAAFLEKFHALDGWDPTAETALKICRLCDQKISYHGRDHGYDAWHATNRALTRQLLQRVGVSQKHVENMTALFESVNTGLLDADIFLMALSRPVENSKIPNPDF